MLNPGACIKLRGSGEAYDPIIRSCDSHLCCVQAGPLRDDEDDYARDWR